MKQERGVGQKTGAWTKLLPETAQGPEPDEPRQEMGKGRLVGAKASVKKRDKRHGKRRLGCDALQKLPLTRATTCDWGAGCANKGAKLKN